MLTCASCGLDNPAGNRFCGACGAPLAVACPSCGTAAPPGFRFCGACGSDLAAPGVDPQPPIGAPVTERRVCSVLFADLVGFTPLSESRDPEEVRELLSRYFDTARTVIARYGGVVEKFIGDAVMAVWGTPVALEGDAERAVRAGLDLVAAVAALGEDVGATGLALRGGVVTGEVAAAVGAVGEGMVAGDAVNTAARVQGAASSGAVWVDEATQRLTAAAIAFRDAGTHALKGKAQPMVLWEAVRVLASVGGRQRVDGLEAPMIGREAEDRTLRDLFHASSDRGSPRLVIVSGTAGSGKSRLGWEFEKYVDGLADNVLWHRGRCLGYGDGVVYWALAEAVRQRFGIAEEDPTAEAEVKFLAGLDRLVPSGDERTYVGVRLGRLLGLVHPQDPGAPLDREDLFSGWRVFLERLASVDPVVLLVEDAQHADDALLDFFEHVVDWARHAPIYMILFARSELTERRPGLGTGRNRTSLSLDPLDERSMRTLVSALVRDLPPAAVTAIVAQAQGNPLFAVETVRSLIDRDVIVPVDGEYRLVGDVGTLSVPDSLHGLLAARLDALDPALRSLVADASVLGSTFSAEALAAVSGRPVGHVEGQLTDLVRRGILDISTDPLSPQRGNYGFSQSMLRQVAYDTLSRRDRRARHLAVAEHLQQAFAGGGDEIMDVVAQHYLDALAAVTDEDDHEIRDRALASLVRGAERAVRAGAQTRAARSFERAADLVAEHDPLGAAELWERSADGYDNAARYETALEVVGRARTVYLERGQTRAAARAQAVEGRVLRLLGRLGEAWDALEEALTELRPEPGVDTVRALAEAASTAVFSGKPDSESRALADEAMGLGQSIDVPLGVLASLFGVQGVVDGFTGRWAQSAAAQRHAAYLAERAGDRSVRARAMLNLAAGYLNTDYEAAAEAAREGYALGRLGGHRKFLGTAISNLVIALLLSGDWDQAVVDLEVAMHDDGLDQDAYTLVVHAVVRALRGMPDDGPEPAPLRMLRDSDGLQDIGLIRWVDAVVAAERGRPREALENLAEVFADGSRLDMEFEGVFWSWPLAVRCAFDLDDLPEVRRLLALLDAQSIGSVPPLMRGARAAALARLAAAEPGADDAAVVAGFDDAITTFRAAGSPYHLAHGLLDQVGCLRDRGFDAEALLDEAVLIAERLGAADVRRRAGALGAVVTADVG